MSLDFSSKVRVDNWKMPTLFDVWFGLNRFLEILSFIGCTGANPGFFWRGLTDNECRNWLVRSTRRFHLRVVGRGGGGVGGCRGWALPFPLTLRWSLLRIRLHQSATPFLFGEPPSNKNLRCILWCSCGEKFSKRLKRWRIGDELWSTYTGRI